MQSLLDDRRALYPTASTASGLATSACSTCFQKSRIAVIYRHSGTLGRHGSYFDRGLRSSFRILCVRFINLLVYLPQRCCILVVLMVSCGCLKGAESPRLEPDGILLLDVFGIGILKRQLLLGFRRQTFIIDPWFSLFFNSINAHRHGLPVATNPLQLRWLYTDTWCVPITLGQHPNHRHSLHLKVSLHTAPHRLGHSGELILPRLHYQALHMHLLLIQLYNSIPGTRIGLLCTVDILASLLLMKLSHCSLHG